jgi:heme exporter protein A
LGDLVSAAESTRAGPALLRAEKLACARGERLLFEGLDFTLAGGEVLLLRGPNGSGKSSLLRLLAGLLPIASGHLSWRGQDVPALGAAYRTELAFLGHLDALKPQLSLRENLRFWAELVAATRDLDEALLEVGLMRNADLPAQILSAGQRRRFGLARLLLRPAPIWLLDEPTTALDRDGQALVLGLIERHLAAGGIAVISSHDALSLGNSITLALGGAS